MATFTFTSPGGKSYSVEGPEGATPDQAFGVLQSQLKSSGNLDYYKNMSGATPVDPTADMGTGERALAGVGMGMSRIGRGVAQAGLAAVDAVAPRQQTLSGIVAGSQPTSRAQEYQGQIDQAHYDEGALENTTAGKAGNVAGQVAALIPTAFIPGANTLGGAALIGAGTGALTTEGGIKERGVAALGGAIGGAGGIAAGRAAGAGLSRLGGRAARIGAENSVKNETIQAARQAGYVLPPSEMAQTGVGKFAARAVEGVAGKAAMGQQASIANQRVTNNLIRRDLGLGGTGQISEAELNAARQPLFRVYEEAAQVSPTSREAVQAWREANNAAKLQELHYSRSFDPRAQTAAQASRQEADGYFQIIQQEAAASGRADLARNLADARIGLARIGTVERALNEATGDVSARDLAKASARGVPLRGGMEQAARFATGFDRFAQAPKTTSMPGVSKLDFVMGAGAAVPLGPGGLAVAVAPTIARHALLSRPVQALARPAANPGASRLRLGNALSGDRSLSYAGATGNALSRR